LPVGVGFGIKTAEKAREIATVADAVVVGSALVERLAAGLDQAGGKLESGGKLDNVVNPVLSLARDLSGAVRAARGVGK
jgi:tryptophan synthase alpha chain